MSSHPTREPTYVVGIDFGTSGSSYCHSKYHKIITKQTFESLTLSEKIWERGTFTFTKTPTVVLINSKKDVLGCGYDAVDKFLEKCDAMDNIGHHFKILDFLKLGLLGKRDLTDVSGRKIEVADIEKLVGHYLSYIKDCALRDLRQKYNDPNIGVGDVKWVVTIPTTYEIEHQRIMKDACVRSGIISSHNFSDEEFLFAFEPESACVYMSIKSTDYVLKDKGVYMVVDCGGGTIDITCHQCTSKADFWFGEVTKSCGANSGSVFINQRFVKFFDDLLKNPQGNYKDKVEGKNIDFSVEYIKKDFPFGWMQLMEGFELAKRKYDGRGTINVKIESKYITRGMQELLEKYKVPIYKKGRRRGGFVEIPKVNMDQFYTPSLDSIEAKITEQVNEIRLRRVDTDGIVKSNIPNNNVVPKIDCVIGVGGFCCSSLVRERISKYFNDRPQLFQNNQVKIVYTSLQDEVVLKGTPFLGNCPSVIKARIAKRTYGVGIMLKWDPTKDSGKPNKKRIVERLEGKKEYCCDRFDALVKKGDRVEENKVITRTFNPAAIHEKEILIHMYATDQLPLPRYIDDCQALHPFKVDISKSTLQTKTRVKMFVHVGKTDFRVSFQVNRQPKITSTQKIALLTENQ